MKANRSTLAPLEQLRHLSTCVVASAIESFHVRLSNVGFTDSRVRCVFEDLPPIAGYAATARIRTAAPPMEGGNYHYERADWWNYILTIPAPRIVVLEDIDQHPGTGALPGEVCANILLALACTGLVTNGAVRDLPEIRALDFALFAGSVSVSHAYAHIFDFGGPVMVGGLEVQPGDLIHADRHGVQTIPSKVLPHLPAAVDDILRKRQQVIALCRSADFSVQKLHDVILEMDRKP